MHKVADRQNEVVEAVNDLGNALHPLIKETSILKNTMKLVKDAMQELTTERDNDREVMETVMADCEQTTTDLLQMCNEITESTNLKHQETDEILDDVRISLNDALDMGKNLEARTEWIDRGQRAHNMIVFGWPKGPDPATPLDDAKRFFSKIGFTLAESFLAYRSAPSLRDGVIRPGILKVTFNSIPTCHRALEASRAHCKDNRELPYFAKPGKTREQERLKRIADEGVRVLRARHPDRDFCERAGRIAEFVATPGGRSDFRGWVPIPSEQDDTMIE